MHKKSEFLSDEVASAICDAVNVSAYRMKARYYYGLHDYRSEMYREIFELCGEMDLEYRPVDEDVYGRWDWYKDGRFVMETPSYTWTVLCFLRELRKRDVL